MRQILLTWIILLFIFCSLFVVKTTSARVINKNGIQVGLNFATQTGADAMENAKSKTGFYGGIVTTEIFNDYFAGTSGLALSIKGAKRESVNYMHKHTLYYLELPIILRLCLPITKGNCLVL